MPFQYKKVLVIGATSGIGEALADKFVENGSHVIAVGRRRERLDAFVHRHGEDKASSMQFDITDTGAMADFVEAYGRTHYTVAILRTMADMYTASQKHTQI